MKKLIRLKEIINDLASECNAPESLQEAKSLVEELESEIDSLVRPNIVKVNELISNSGFPGELGRQLAEKLISINWNITTLDVNRMRPEILVCNFYIEFYKTLREHLTNDDFEASKRAKWITEFDFQQRSIESWIP